MGPEEGPAETWEHPEHPSCKWTEYQNLSNRQIASIRAAATRAKNNVYAGTQSPERPVVTTAMKRWLSWIADGGLVLRSVGAVYTYPSCKPDIRYGMAEKLLNSGLVSWQPKPVDRYPVKRDMLVITEFGKDVLEGKIRPPAQKSGARNSLGRRQLDCLQCLVDRGPWSPLGIMSGWVLDNDSGTLRVVKSLEKRGLVDMKREFLGKGKNFIERFYINDAGRKALEAGKA
jgi:hypothetical protein